MKEYKSTFKRTHFSRLVYVYLFLIGYTQLKIEIIEP